MSGSDPREDEDLIKSLNILTGDLLPVRRIETKTIEGRRVITKGRYFIEEEDLPEHLKGLLHGRAYVVDKDVITEVSSATPRTYYISADKTKGVIVPARSLSISSENGTIHYRWTDNGEQFTAWISLPDGAIDSYLQQEEVRFAEIQVYADTPDTLLSIRGTR